MKVLVAYKSLTGNTKMIAEAIYDVIDVNKDIKQIDDVEEFDGYDLCFLGFPILNHGPDEAVESFLKDETKGKKIALFITHGAPEGADFLEEWLDKFIKAASEAEIVGLFDCQGRMAEPIINIFLNSQDERVINWAKSYKPNNYPDTERIEKAKDFARDILEKINS